MNPRPETRYKCDQCGCKKLQRQFYVWRDEDKDDPEAFDFEGAGATELGHDWWCPVCKAHTFGEEYLGRSKAECDVMLAAFARDILAHMEAEAEWSADTLIYIAQAAIAAELAEPDLVEFTRKEDAK